MKQFSTSAAWCAARVVSMTPDIMMSSDSTMTQDIAMASAHMRHESFKLHYSKVHVTAESSFFTLRWRCMQLVWKPVEVLKY